VDGSPDVRSYLKFDITGLSGSVTGATLRIYANSASSSGIAVWSIADNTWTETGIIYNNAPALPPAWTSLSGAVVTGAWIELDVSTLVTGNGTISFAITTPGSTAISLASRNAAVNQPELVIQTN
jgi:hypothetical protein